LLVIVEYTIVFIYIAFLNREISRITTTILNQLNPREEEIGSLRILIKTSMLFSIRPQPEFHRHRNYATLVSGKSAYRKLHRGGKSRHDGDVNYLHHV
jgi:hypothetical protein